MTLKIGRWKDGPPSDLVVNPKAKNEQQPPRIDALTTKEKEEHKTQLVEIAKVIPAVVLFFQHYTLMLPIIFCV